VQTFGSIIYERHTRRDFKVNASVAKEKVLGKNHLMWRHLKGCPHASDELKTTAKVC